LVTKTGDETADRFFSSTYYGNVENTYFPLYLLALHQKYALLALANEAAGLPAQLAARDEDALEQNRLLTSLKKKIADFLLRSSYKQVSNVTHQADFYSFVRDRLRVDDLFGELREALEALASLTEVAEEKQRRTDEERRREQSERFNRKITAITAIYLPLTVAVSFFGLDLDGMDWRSFAACVILLYGCTYALFRYWLNK
jgi:Mg2+ and Co2+ transporter CorA